LALREEARTPHAAQKRYLRYLQRSLSCLTDSRWIVGPPPAPTASEEERALTISEAQLRLKRQDNAPLLFTASQRFELVPDEKHEGEWKASTHGYVYRVSLETTDGDAEIIGWHWHPTPTPRRPQPHVHVRSEQPYLGVTFSRLHIPSGRVAFEEVVRFLIAELQVLPNRRDWVEVLTDSEDRFRAYRTWA